jgi:glycosyltransferase involved in cell wall biosynthesis
MVSSKTDNLYAESTIMKAPQEIYNIAINPCGIGGTQTFSRVLNSTFLNSHTYSFKKHSNPYFDAPHTVIELKSLVKRIPKCFRWAIPRSRRYDIPPMHGIIIFNALTDIERVPLSYLKRNKVIYLAHNEPNYILSHKAYLGKRTNLRLARMKYADMVISLSPSYNHSFAEMFSIKPEMVRAVTHTIDIAPVKQGKERKRSIITICRLDNKQKRFDRMVEVAKGMPDHLFEIYGMGNDEALVKEMIREIPNVNFMGKTTDISATHKDAGIFLMTSDYEGLSIAILESLSQATPVVIAKNCFGMARSIVRDGENGFVCEEFSALDTIEKIKAVEKGYEEFSENALESFKPFGHDAFIDQWNAIFNAL